MAGPFDPPSPADPTGFTSFLDTPEIRRQRMFDTLGGISAALIQASAPSMVPRDIGSVLAAGIGGGAASGHDAQDKYLKRAMVGSQVAKAQSEIENEKKWAGMFAPGAGVGAPATDASAPSAPAGGQQASPWAPTPQAQEMVAYLQQKHGFNPVQAATAVGNFQQESSLNPTQVHDGGTGFGIGGWRDPEPGQGRKTALMNYAKLKGADVNDPRVQADFFVDELKTRPEWQQFSQAQDPQQAATALMTYFRPRDYTPQNPTAGHGFQNRVQYAQTLMPGGQVAQGDGPNPSPAGPVQQAQYQPPQPRTMQDVINTMPPGVKQMVGAMGRKDGMAIVLKYADPGSEAVLDTQTGGVVFIPKTMVGRDPRFQPVKGAELEISRGQLVNSQRKTDIDARNADVILGPDGQPMVNQPAVDAKKAVSAAQGSGALEPHADKVLIDQGAKAHDELQAAGLKSRTALAQVNRLSTLLDQVGTGKFTGSMQELKQTAKALGVDLAAIGVKDDTAPAQAAVSLANQFALSLRDPSSGGGMPGALSDSDRKFLAAMVPGLEATPGGRKLMVDFMTRMYQRNIDLAKVANDYVRSGGLKKDPAGIYAQLQQYADANPLFDPAKDAPVGGMSPMPGAPPPPAGYTVPGQTGGAPKPPAGFRIVQ